jgi:hypothetical protein
VRCRVTNAHLALKVLGGHSGQRESDALVREVVALSGLEGLGLPQILRLGKLPNSGKPYVIRELVDGHALDHVARTDPARAMRLLCEVAEQLTVLHRSGLLHGDIKPANIIARSDGTVTLVDFGLAAPWKEGGVAPEGMTPRYAAPELLRGGPLTVRAEIYSLGVILTELLRAASELGVLGGAQTDLPEVTEVARVATDAEPSWRYPSTDEFAAELRRALGTLTEEQTGSRGFAWPVRGIETTAARVQGLVQAMSGAEVLALLGLPGSGRSTILHRVGFSLGIAGKPIAILDEAVSTSTEMALLELDSMRDEPDCYCLVDDVERLSPEVLHRLEAMRALGAKLVTVGQSERSPANTSFTVPPLPSEICVELIRGAVP